MNAGKTLRGQRSRVILQPEVRGGHCGDPCIVWGHWGVEEGLVISRLIREGPQRWMYERRRRDTHSLKVESLRGNHEYQNGIMIVRF